MKLLLESRRFGRTGSTGGCETRCYDQFMPVDTHRIQIQTRGNDQVLDLTPHLTRILQQSQIKSGTATLFIIGSTAGLTTTEYEPGLVNHDLHAFFERIAPADGDYRHEATWKDDNGHSHVRASLLGPSLVVPFVDRNPTLGQWQQVILIDFDTRPRTREVVVQLVGDA
jgi:secondary thiamine-phosphate synthase enzyme